MPSSSPAPSTTPAPPGTTTAQTTFPLAAVTGITSLRANVAVAELERLAKAGDLMLPCDIRVTRPLLPTTSSCVPADAITARLAKSPNRIALLPTGLVEPATKVLSIRGTGPYGMFGPDLFGDPQARSLPYPIVATADAGAALAPDWTAYDSSEVWTLTNVGSLCADRGGARQVVRNGRSWEWVIGGGTARYAAPAVVDPPDRKPYRSVQPVDTGHDGVTGQVLKRSDIAIADHECPIVPDADWTPQLGTTTVFSVPEAVVPVWKDTLGLDVVYLAANHLSDKGVRGIRSTLQLIDKHGIARTGLGLDLDEALEPAYAEAAGVKVGFVAVNDVPGVAEADAATPGVPWITAANIRDGVRRAKAAGADIVICTPQWWGGAEYHDELWPTQAKQLTWFDKEGCDHVIGSGTHVAGPLLLRGTGDPSLVLASPGNFLFGQSWWQETQEGVILDLSFRGTVLVNVRLRPTVMVREARPALLDPQVDGRYVLQRIWKYSTLPPQP